MLILSIDSCTNSRRMERHLTISLKGSKQPKLSRPKPVYTNCYVKAVELDEKGDFPCLMFTHDPAFKEGALDQIRKDNDRVLSHFTPPQASNSHR